MKEGKYIVFKDGSVRVFKKHHVNAWMADGKPASSAGYFRTVNGKVECSRESGTLGIKAHEDDAEIIAPDMQMGRCLPENFRGEQWPEECLATIQQHDLG